MTTPSLPTQALPLELTATGSLAAAQGVVLLDPTTGNPLPAPLPAAAWAAGGTAFDARSYGSSEAQVTSLSGGDTIAFTRSLDGSNYAPVSWIDQTFATGSTISANGIYSFPGGGYLKWAKTGSASTPTVTVRAAS